MTFTMNYTAHPERKTTFTKVVEQPERMHALMAIRPPSRFTARITL
uniref:Uncharacterized protein n=1 Tax=Cyanothece sp. (strain PCC 7425 / ATCC 29141) TaxID=395961 RepID=B8HT91_CYAP4